jgi:hypothetical protein
MAEYKKRRAAEPLKQKHSLEGMIQSEIERMETRVGVLTEALSAAKYDLRIAKLALTSVKNVKKES